MQCPRCQQENLTSHKCCRECGTPLAHLEGGAQPAPSYADLQRFLTEARDQQAATSEILRVISRSPTNLQPVLDAIATNAALVCDAYDAVVFLREGDRVRPAAHYGPITITLQHSILNRDSVTEVAILDHEPVHVHDLLATEPSAFPRTTTAARQGGYRTALSVPLLGENEAIGALAIRRREIQPFTTQQIELLQTFAAQAVIAIENARLFTEAQEKNLAVTQAHAQATEALEQQTATSEILRVISSSPTDVRPVFDAIVLNASRLCGGEYAIVIRYDGEMMHLAAQHNPRPGAAEPVARLFPRAPTRGSSPGRAILTRSLVHIPDALADPEYDPDVVNAAGLRGVLSVPMFRDGKVIGAISISRDKPGAFAPSQIELLQTFADQAVIAIENARLFKELEVRNNELSEALDQQTATSEILRVISSSPNDVQPVFGTIAATALRLCDATLCTVFRFDGDFIHLVAHHQVSTHGASAYRDAYPARPGRGGGTHRAILTGSTVHIRDIREDPEYELHALARANDFGCVLSVPMLREGVPIGAITVGRAAGRAFSDSQIQLLKTFADQAVIAIQNVRLFTELQTSNRELTTALDTQTATSDILRVISLSQTDVQPVFDAIVTSAVKLLRGFVAAMSRLAGDRLELAAFTNSDAAGDAAVRSAFPQLLDSDWPHSRVVRDRIVLNVADARSDPQLPKAIRNVAGVRGYQSLVVLPILRHDDAVGAISVTRREPGGFTDDEIALLKTFADQAVIAIENVRLFTELQTSNRELTTALDKQTATSDILRVISRSQTNINPVFDSILSSAIRLLGAYAGALTRIVDDQIELAALTRTDDAGEAAVRAAFPQPLQSDWPHAQAIRDRTPLNIADAQTDPRLPEAEHVRARVRGFRSRVLVPILRQDEAVGAISVSRREPGGFKDDEIALLQTFADQAGIAIENARVLSELQARTAELTRSVEQLTALGEVGRAVSSTLDLETVLTTIVTRAVQLSELDGGVVFEYDADAEVFVHRAATETGANLAAARRATQVRKGEGVVGQTAITLEPAQVPDITVPGAYESRLRENLIASGVRAILAVPMLSEAQLVGCLVVSRNQPGEFPGETIELLRTFATQSALAIQNARLFAEIADKSCQLEATSRHKSEFLANMSHELRTPLNAVIGFSEVLLQRMFGELNDKQDEYLKDIYASGQHLLSLINDILDLSKIEAGRMELAPAPFHLPTALDNAVTLVKERASRHGITLQVDIDPRLGEFVGDERKVKQVLLNLLSNAVKFTPEGGRISLRASRKDRVVEIAVTDTGIGIAPEDQAAIFEEFRQVGTDETRKQEGTGLGLTLAKKFVELHGGRIWVESNLGQGTTFTFTLPVS